MTGEGRWIVAVVAVLPTVPTAWLGGKRWCCGATM